MRSLPWLRPRRPESGGSGSVWVREGPCVLACALTLLLAAGCETARPPPGKPGPDTPPRPPAPAPTATAVTPLPYDQPRRWQVANWSDDAELLPPDAKKEPWARLTARQAKAGKVAIFTAARDLDLAHHAELVADFQSPPTRNYPVLVTAAIQVGEPAQWVESAPRLLPARAFVTVSFPLAVPEWKCEQTQWRHQTTPLGKGAASHVFLIIHGLANGEAVSVNNVRATQAAAPVVPPADRTLGPRPAGPAARHADPLKLYVGQVWDAYLGDLRAAGLSAEAKALEGKF